MQNISVEKLKAKIDSGEKVRIVDVREPDENAEYTIGGILLPLGEIMNFQIDAIEDLKDEEVFVHCRSGKRSLQACVFLEQAGFTNIFNIEGGILAWQAKFEQKV